MAILRLLNLINTRRIWENNRHTKRSISYVYWEKKVNAHSKIVSLANTQQKFINIPRTHIISSYHL